jgi:Spy/CpxP family protein refolding chaperone
MSGNKTITKKARFIVSVLAVLAITSSAPAGKNDSSRDPSRIPGSKVRQLMLKRSLEKFSETLVAELNQNKELWQTMTPEKLRSLRERYYAFLKQDGGEQIALIEAAEKFGKLTDEQRQAYLKRAEWLEKVISSLTPQQREELRNLTPKERAKKLLELKAKLPGSQPTSQPVSESTTQPEDPAPETE